MSTDDPSVAAPEWIVDNVAAAMTTTRDTATDAIDRQLVITHLACTPAEWLTTFTCGALVSIG